MRYYEKTTPAAAYQNGQHRPQTADEQNLKYVERITPARNAPSFLRIFILPVAAAVILSAIAAYGLWSDPPDPLGALAVGALVGLPVAWWRVRVWDDQPTDSIDRREYQDLPAPAAEPKPLIRPEIVSSGPGRQTIKYGRFTYSAEAWTIWAEVLRDNDFHITREILSQVRVNGRCIFTNLTTTYNDLVGEMHRLGWTNHDKTDLSPAGIDYFQQYLDPPTPADPPRRRP